MYITIPPCVSITVSIAVFIVNCCDGINLSASAHCFLPNSFNSSNMFSSDIVEVLLLALYQRNTEVIATSTIAPKPKLKPAFPSLYFLCAT